jgi:hypothetical protein
LEEQITKHSSVLGRDAVFNKAVGIFVFGEFLII